MPATAATVRWVKAEKAVTAATAASIQVGTDAQAASGSADRVAWEVGVEGSMERTSWPAR
jgi:hypothetical protein